jgi:8-oxo-dGTP pyrophosphatase MutT (NUDIX family)
VDRHIAAAMTNSNGECDEAPPIRRTRQNLVFENRFAKVYNDPVVFRDQGIEGSYLRIVEADGKPGVAMLAICQNQAALVRAYRYPTGSWEWAIPRGFAHGNDPEASARTELAEELGGEPDELITIGIITPNSGILASEVHIYLARFAAPVSLPEDRTEVAEVNWLDLADLYHKIADAKIKDAFTLSAVALAHARGLIQLPTDRSGRGDDDMHA